MKLSKDCVRNLMLFVESLDTPGAGKVQIIEFGKENYYSQEELIYTIQKLKEANYIDSTLVYGDNKVSWFNRNSVTYDGHQFIDTIKDNLVWAHVKEEASKLKDVPINILAQLAKRYIENTFNL
jgi:hypothetical protein